jgi:hypothetical protein
MIFEKVYYKHKQIELSIVAITYVNNRKSFSYRSWDRISREPHLQRW